MSKGSEAVIKHRQSKIDSGWLRIDGLLPPDAASEARLMVGECQATSLIHAAAVALSERFYARQAKCTKPVDING